MSHRKLISYLAQMESKELGCAIEYEDRIAQGQKYRDLHLHYHYKDLLDYVIKLAGPDLLDQMAESEEKIYRRLKDLQQEASKEDVK